MRIASRLYAPDPAERRVFGRVAANFRARIGRGREQAQEVSVNDLSCGGFRVEGWRNLESGMDVVIDLPGVGTRLAHVVWTVGRQAGCEFGIPLDEARFAELVARHTPPPARPARPAFGRKGSG